MFVTLRTQNINKVTLEINNNILYKTYLANAVLGFVSGFCQLHNLFEYQLNMLRSNEKLHHSSFNLGKNRFSISSYFIATSEKEKNYMALLVLVTSNKADQY